MPLGQSLLPLGIAEAWARRVVAETKLTDSSHIRRLVCFNRVRHGWNWGSAMAYAEQVACCDDWTLFFACLRAQGFLAQVGLDVF